MIRKWAEKEGDRQIAELEQASKLSASGEKTLDDFCTFLDNFKALVALHKPGDCDISRLIKRKQICYHIASKQVDDSPETIVKVCNILPKFKELICSQLFIDSANCDVICDWLVQVMFLLETISPENDALKLDKTDSLIVILAMTNKLIQIFADCFERIKCHGRLEIDRSKTEVFEKVWIIVKLCSSLEFKSNINRDALELMNQITLLLKEPQFLAIFEKETTNAIANKLWSIVQNELRQIVIRFYSHFYKIDQSGKLDYKNLTQKTEAITAALPCNGQSFEFFCKSLKKESQPEEKAADLAILGYMLQANNYHSCKLWPILKVHLATDDSVVRNKALEVTIDALKMNNFATDEIDCLLRLLESIRREIFTDWGREHIYAIANIIRLITLIPEDFFDYQQYKNLLAKVPKMFVRILALKQSKSFVILATQTIEKLHGKVDADWIVFKVRKQFSSRYESKKVFLDDTGDCLLGAQLKLFEKYIALKDDKGEKTAMVKSIIKIIVTEKYHRHHREVSYYPDGVDLDVISLIKTIIPECTNAMLLLPLARKALFPKIPVSIDSKLKEIIYDNVHVFHGKKAAYKAFLKLCHLDRPGHKRCLYVGGLAKNCLYCEEAKFIEDE